jgi:hypothetical protein
VSRQRSGFFGRLSGRLLAGLGFLLAATGCVNTSATKPEAAVAGPWHRVELGLCEDYPEESRTVPRAQADLAAARAAGARVLRIALGWDSIEERRGQYDWSFWDDFVRMAGEYGITLLPYVCYTPKWAASDPGENYWRSPPRDPSDFGRFMAVVAQHYRDRIHSWELWNEPDNQAYWLGTPTQFAALVRAGSRAVRAVDPGARVVLGGIAGEIGFLATLLRDERIGPEVDVINIHSYFETWHPNAIEMLPAYIARAANLVRESGGEQRLWMAETGYSTVGERADVSGVYRAHYRGEHTEAAQARAVLRTIVTTLATEQVALIAWYRINDLIAGQEVIGDDNNRHLGVRRVDGSAKPAYAAFAFLAGLFHEPYAMIPTSIVSHATADTQPVVHAFQLRDGHCVIAAWLAMPSTPAGAEPGLDNRQASVRFALPVHAARKVTWFDATGRASAPPDAFWRNVASHRLELGFTLRGGESVVAIVE